MGERGGSSHIAFAKQGCYYRVDAAVSFQDFSIPREDVTKTLRRSERMSDTTMFRKLNDNLWNFLRGMIKDLSDEQVSYSTTVLDGRSIAAVAVHAYGSVLYFANIIAGISMERPKKLPELTTTAALLELIDKVHAQVEQRLAELPDSALEQPCKMPWGQEIKGSEALSGVMAHSLVHVGNIQGIRAIGGFPTPPENYG